MRLFVEEEDTTLHLLLDASRSMAWGEPTKLDFARRCAAALGYVALSRTEWVAPLAFTPGQEPAPRSMRGRRSAGRLFDRQTFASDECFVDFRGSFDNFPVYRHVLAGSDDDNIANDQLRDR